MTGYTFWGSNFVIFIFTSLVFRVKFKAKTLFLQESTIRTSRRPILGKDPLCMVIYARAITENVINIKRKLFFIFFFFDVTFLTRLLNMVLF